MTTQYAIQITAKDTVGVNPAMPVPEIGPSQILLKVQACGICFSDTKLMHAFESHPRKSPILSGIDLEKLAAIPTYRPGSDPVVPGHEPVAVVAAVGESVTRFHVGQRVLVQTDYRHLPTASANGAFGYDFDGALEEYALVDEAMVIDPISGESYLIDVGDEPAASAVALVEPWACVETAYAWSERQHVKKGGSLLVVVDEGVEPLGLEDLVVAGEPSRFIRVGQAAGLEKAQERSLGELDGTFDDIVYIGADPETVETLSPFLGNRGLMAIVTCGRTFSREVSLDPGRVHYDLIRYAGTTSSNVLEAYSWIPATCDLRVGDKVGVIGAAGPMGLMHAVRTATAGVENVTLDAIDVDDDRLSRLHAVLEPIAAKAGTPTRIVNSRVTPLEPGVYTYVALMVPAPALLKQSVEVAGRDSIVNAFAGFAIGTMSPLDLNKIVGEHVYLVGTSGSRIVDMVTVLRRLEAGTVDTNISLDAVTGMAGVVDAIESVNNRTSQGKIMVYPYLHNLGLTRLVEMPEKMPKVAAALKDGLWTKAAEEALIAEETKE
ncbi:MAG: alcohol dehydrogenase catalytic domain-containing protein [Propionibacteriaceae bacterium]|jgi:threonine dehydrogenase-like Zn-dependent dehydrogenase|nr:alcohol dehydrogenase catalytic domain-containing protein [Propionibacteriaceae bacterium]